MRIEIVDAKPVHVGLIARRLRPEDCVEIVALHGEPRKAIRRVFRGSPYRRAALVDGEIAALWGLYGTLLSTEAYVWLASTPDLSRVSAVKVVRTARKELAEMLQSREVLRGHVAADYTRARRFLELAGFREGETRPLGRWGEMFCDLAFG
jgi:hypothetical protein